MEVRQLLWDHGNRADLAGHRITDGEVEDLVELNEWTVESHAYYAGQVRIIGRASSGRWLTVAMEATSDPATWRPITGWDSTEAEKAYYWNQ